jgi:Flp pilus assembly protein TadB
MSVVVLGAAGTGIGVVGFVWALLGRRSAAGHPAAPQALGGRRLRPLQVAAVVLAAVAGAGLTGWPVAGLLAGVGAGAFPWLWAETADRRRADRHEAIALWTEMLRDTLHASAGLSQAIVATAPIAPDAIRSSVQSLAGKLVAGVPVARSLRAFADELDDASADAVVCALLLAAGARAQRLADLLGALAAATRDDVAMRLRVEAVRASARSGVRIVVVFSAGFVVALAVLAHSYLAPFATPVGQLVLLVAGSCDAVGIWLFVRLTRGAALPRLLPRREVAPLRPSQGGASTTRGRGAPRAGVWS